MKEIAPSTELRKWFAHKPGRFAEFGERYEKELGEDRVKVQLDQLRANMEKDTVTLLYGAKDEQHNHAIILKRILERT